MKLIITGAFDDEIAANLIERGYRISRLGANAADEDLKRELSDADAYIMAGNEILTPELLDHAKKLRLIIFLGEQPDTFMAPGVVDAMKARGINCTNTPGVATNAVAEMACALILGSLRRIPYLTSETRAGRWPELTGSELMGKTLGIYGMGKIGYTVVERLIGFDFDEIFYSDIYPSEKAENDFGAVRVELEQLFDQSDVISIHAPLNPQTEGIVGEDLLRRMNPWGTLVNTARAGIVNPEALRKALMENWLACAAFDGYYIEGSRFMELIPDSDPYGLIRLTDRFFLTSHQGFNTFEAVHLGSEAAVAKLKEQFGK